jgi:AbrB family looped-hinge helix DNA binding protein
MPSIIKVKEKGQVTLPATIREQIGLAAGDFLEARVERGKITLEPKEMLPRGIVQGLADIRRGRIFGPFTAGKATQWLKDEAGKGSKAQRA